jgi:divalent metal cation (Fe/Co/Zn/Cd) transporter
MSQVEGVAVERQVLLRRGIRLEYLTVGWNILEGVIAVAAAIASGSVALLGFGIDSFVESISGTVLIWRLRAEHGGGLDEEAIERTERSAERLVGASFLLLAGFVVFEASRTLLVGDRPDASLVGVALTAVSLVVMLWLARAKRITGEQLGSRALVADAAQTRACWYLSAATLAGLALNAAFGLWWADPIAAYVIAWFLVREGLEAWRGEEHDR